MRSRGFIVLASLTFALTFGLAKPWRMHAQTIQPGLPWPQSIHI